MSDSETQDMLSPFYENFIQLQSDGSLEPWLITEWEANAEATVWTLRVREGVTCHNGEAFEADDVIYTLLRARDHPDGRRKGYIAGFGAPESDSMRAIDSHTVEINSGTPYPLIPGDLAWLFAMCKDYSEEVGDEGLSQRPVGTGPFVFDEYRPAEHIRGSRFEDYWGDPADFANFITRIIPQSTTRLAALITGETDYAGALTLDEAATISQIPGLRVESAPSTLVVTIRYATDPVLPSGGPNPFVDIRVREAAAHAIDVDSIIESIMQGEAEERSQLWIPAVRGYDPTIERLPYDPDRARQLLAEAGYPDGFDINFDAPTGWFVNDALVAQVLADMLAQVGIRANLNLEAPTLHQQKFQNGQSDMFLTRYGQGNLDLYSTAVPFVMCEGQNSGKFGCYPEIDEMARAANMETDLERRAELLREVNRLWTVENRHYISLYEFNRLSGASDRVDWQPGWIGRARVPDFRLAD